LQEIKHHKDTIIEVLKFAESFIRVEIQDRLEACKLSRFPTFCNEINTSLYGCTQEAKAKTYEFVNLIIEVDSVALPGTIPQSCSIKDEKQMCTICQFEIPAPDGGGTATLQCSATASHSFHVKCFIGSVSRGYSTCPTCRKPFPSVLDKLPNSINSSIDPVLLFTLKAIAKYLVPAVRDNFPALLESGFVDKITEEYARNNYKERNEDSTKREMFSEQYETLRRTLMEVMKYTA